MFYCYEDASIPHSQELHSLLHPASFLTSRSNSGPLAKMRTISSLSIFASISAMHARRHVPCSKARGSELRGVLTCAKWTAVTVPEQELIIAIIARDPNLDLLALSTRSGTSFVEEVSLKCHICYS
jgi:hypothetical protein